MHPAVIYPPAPAQTAPLTSQSLEEIAEGIMERQQQQQKQQPEQRKQTKTCLACGQPKSCYENDGSSVHFFFYQQGPVRYFYCSTKVFKAYSGEGLTKPRMAFQDFMETEFIQRELASTKKWVEEKRQQKRKRPEGHRHQGMKKEMTWKEFQKSAFYEMERQRWVAERRKQK
ncbi:uncharacterized protein LOC116715905 [Tachysurus ichikawai]